LLPFLKRSNGSTKRSHTRTRDSPEIVTENLVDKTHSDPRWLRFLARIGKAPEQLAKIEFKMPPLPQ